MDDPRVARHLNDRHVYSLPLPNGRPEGLRRRSLAEGTRLWRIDRAQPDSWTWGGFDRPRHRFDPAGGTFRTRYASQSPAGAARERYLDTGRFIPADHREHHLVRLTTERRFRVLDLRTEANLDALDVDDRISTSHEPTVWATCHHLADAVGCWWPDDVDGIVYRSRTTPRSWYNLAFFGCDALTVESVVLDDSDVLTDLVLRHQFTIDW